MNPSTEDRFDRNAGVLAAEETLRLIATLPAPAGLEDRVKAGLRSAPRRGTVISWPFVSDGQAGCTARDAGCRCSGDRAGGCGRGLGSLLAHPGCASAIRVARTALAQWSGTVQHGGSNACSADGGGSGCRRSRDWRSRNRKRGRPLRFRSSSGEERTRAHRNAPTTGRSFQCSNQDRF